MISTKKFSPSPSHLSKVFRGCRKLERATNAKKLEDKPYGCHLTVWHTTHPRVPQVATWVLYPLIVGSFYALVLPVLGEGWTSPLRLSLGVLYLLLHLWAARAAYVATAADPADPLLRASEKYREKVNARSPELLRGPYKAVGLQCSSGHLHCGIFIFALCRAV